MKFILYFIAVFFPTTTYATPIWSGISLGMTKTEVSQTLNRPIDDNQIEVKHIEILENCKAEADIIFKDDKVSKIIFKGDGSLAGYCSETILVALSSKYGQPLDIEDTGFTIFRRNGRFYVWNRPDGTTMYFKKFSDTKFGGSILINSSWELTFSSIGKDLPL